MLSDGRFALVWSQGDNQTASIKARWFAADGTAAATTFTIATGTWAQNPWVQAATDAAGNLLVTWHQGGYVGEEVWAASLSAAGSVTRAAWKVNAGTAQPHKYPAVSLNAAGQGMIAWTDFTGGYGASTVKARIVSDYGLTAGNEIEVAAGSGYDTLLATATGGTGDRVVTWATDGDIYAQRYNADGTANGLSFLVNTARGGATTPKVAMSEAHGYFVIGWTADGKDPGPIGGSGAFAQLFNPDGQKVGGEFTIPSSTDYSQALKSLVIDADADITAVFDDRSYHPDPGYTTPTFRQFRVNLPPTPAPQTLDVPENSTGAIGQLTATDPDGDVLSYTLLNESPFEISAAGVVSVRDSAALDFETSPTFVLDVRVTDAGSPSLSAPMQVTINLTNVNEAPIVATGGPYTLDDAQTLLLDASGSRDSDAGDSLGLYQWDLDNNGTWDRTGITPRLALTPQERASFGLGVGAHTVRLRVADAALLSATSSTTVTVTPAPEPVHISVADADAPEGTTTTSSLYFTISLDRAVSGPVTVRYTTVAGTATEGIDYDAASGTVTFAAGETQQTVVVTTRADETIEADEMLGFLISGATATGREAVIDVPQAAGLITNDDGANVSINNASVIEGNAGTRVLVFTVRLPRAADVPVTVNYATADWTATAADGDYVAAQGELTFAAGETSRTLAVAVKGDNIVERNELVRVLLSNLQAGDRTVSLGRANGVGQIQNDDAANVSIGDASISEGPAGAMRYLTFTVTLSGPVDAAATLSYATTNGNATAGSDYVAQAGKITFAKGATSRSIRIAIKGDNLPEAHEAFFVDLKAIAPAGRNVRIARSRGVGTILNDDGGSANSRRFSTDAAFAAGLADTLLL